MLRKVISREESNVEEKSDISVVDETFREEVQLFDWELLQQEIEDYLFSNQSKCEIENAFCFFDNKGDERDGNNNTT